MRYFVLLISLYACIALADDPAANSPISSSANQEAAPKQEVATEQEVAPELQAAPQMPRVVMARVGNEEITVEQFMNFLVKHPQHLKQATTTAGKAKLLRNAIENRLLILALREEGLLAEGAPIDEKLPILVQKLAEKRFPPPPPPDEEKVRHYYEEHKADFGIPASARVSQILIRVPESATDKEKAAALERAEAALKRIEAGESFADVAAEVTDNPGPRERKGDVGYLKRYVSEWFDQAVEGLEVGEHTRVLQSPAGYEILLLTDLRDPIITPYAEARDAVVRALAVQAQAKVRAAYVKELAKRHGVSIELDELKGEYPNGVFP